MPTNPFDDMPPPIEEKKQTVKSVSRSKSLSNINNTNNSSPSKLETKLTSMKSKLSIRKGGKFNRKQIDDISVSDSLCSGVLRDAAQFNIGNSIGSSLGMRSTLSSSNSMSSLGNTHSSRRSSAQALISSGVADFDESLSNWKKINTSAAADNSPSVKSIKSLNSSSESVNNNNKEESSAAIPSSPDTQRRREQRKERVKEKLDRYKRDQKALKKSCLALEQQLAITTDKLREVDSKAAFKIDALESELRETRKGMEGIAKSSNKEVTDQSECIKTLGKKLIRQAHVIKRQKNAVEQYKIQLEAMNEEMAMQDERDSEREAELEELEEQLDSIKEQKTQMNNLLQENIEEMRVLKGETEKDAKNIMELEFNLQQKEATLDRVAKDVSEKAMKISELEESLEEKNRELDALKEELKESENSVQTMQQCLESASRDSFLFKQRTASGITDDDEGEEEDGGASSNDRASSMSIGASMASSQAAGGGTESLRRTSQVSQANSRRGSQRSWFNREASARSSFMGDDGEVSPETFEAELNAKDTTIATLNDTVTEHEETINNLRSEMVKMSSTYKQDSYLKRKEIAKLKQQNAEYALKLRALEKAFKCVNATEGMSVVGSNFHGHTSHGGGGSKHGGSLHGNNSRHSRSTHSVGEVSSKIDKAAAVKARLGGFPYEFPSSSSVRRDSAVVQEANFFDDGISEQGSDLGMKGQSPEEN